MYRIELLFRKLHFVEGGGSEAARTLIKSKN